MNKNALLNYLSFEIGGPSAEDRKKVAIELHIYEEGDHRFSAHLFGRNEEWIDRFRN